VTKAGRGMLGIKKILLQIENNIDAVIADDTALGVDLWQLLVQQHPADVATLVERLSEEQQLGILKKLPKELAINTFKYLESLLQAVLLIELDTDQATSILNKMPADELTDLFDHLSDEDLEKYLKLLQKKERNRIISLLNFNPRSAGGRMNSDVISLQKDFTVKKCIDLLQRLGPQKDVMERIYITNKDHVLVGHITLDKLVLTRPETFLSQIIQKNELIVYVDEDQEDVADQMHHYGLSSVPVVDKQNHFLGVITAQDVVEIIKEEESEDVYKMSGLASSVSHGYFSTSVWRLIWHRSVWLISLMLFQSVSGMIMGTYNSLIQNHVIISFFLTMLIGTGGNAGNQSATLVIRGLINNEISRDNAAKVLWREFRVGLAIASLLVVFGFFRVYYFYRDVASALAINISLFFIVITSMIVGAMIPIILERFNLDPAHSAAPFLTTLMDIVGVLICCFICSKILV
jgi:magnesium transporter